VGLSDAPVDLLRVRRRLAEAIAWCAPRAAAGEPGDSLWTPALRPSGVGARPSWAALQAASRPPFVPLDPLPDQDARLDSFPVEERADVVEALERARAAALDAGGGAAEAPADDLGGGRLVLFDAAYSVYDGASEFVTRGFFDVGDVPAWDTWVSYAVDPARAAAGERQRAGGAGPSAAESGFDDYLVAWVPPVLVGLVGEGIGVNPVGCLAWAEDVDTTLPRLLRAAGIL
jgi:hypothetical protein